jgi:predicted anti-sigma-YlaC factor YlaD
MSLSDEQISDLVKLAAGAETDPLDCDGCFAHLAEFAEFELAKKGIPEALRAVETHLRQCQCCQAEFEALLEALRTLDAD